METLSGRMFTEDIGYTPHNGVQLFNDEAKVSINEHPYLVKPSYEKNNPWLLAAFSDPEKFLQNWQSIWHPSISEEWRNYFDNHFDQHDKSFGPAVCSTGVPLFFHLQNRVSAIQSEFTANMDAEQMMQSTSESQYASVVNEESEKNIVIRQLVEKLIEHQKTGPTLSNKTTAKASRAVHVPIHYKFQKDELIIIRPDKSVQEDTVYEESADKRSWEPDPNSWPWVAQVLESDENSRELLIAWWGFTNNDKHLGAYYKLVADDPSTQEELHKHWQPQHEETILTDFCQWVDMDTVAMAGVKLIGPKRNRISQSTFKKWATFMRTDCDIGVVNDSFKFKQI